MTVHGLSSDIISSISAKGRQLNSNPFFFFFFTPKKLCDVASLGIKTFRSLHFICGHFRLPPLPGVALARSSLKISNYNLLLRSRNLLNPADWLLVCWENRNLPLCFAYPTRLPIASAIQVSLTIMDCDDIRPAELWFCYLKAPPFVFTVQSKPGLSVRCKAGHLNGRGIEVPFGRCQQCSKIVRSAVRRLLTRHLSVAGA